MSSSPPPESGLTGHEKQAEASPESGHRTPDSGHRKGAEEVILKPVKPETAAEGEGNGTHISITVKSQTAPEVLFRVKRDILMQRVMDMYCGKHSLTPKAVAFLNDKGEHICAAQTAEQAGFEDGSTIDVFLRMDGGSGRSSV